MTLEDAIKHCEEVAEANERTCKAKPHINLESYLECAAQHRELAEWLKELKQHREAWQKVKEELKEEMTGLDMFIEKEHTIRWCLHVIDEALGEVGEQDG